VSNGSTFLPHNKNAPLVASGHLLGWDAQEELVVTFGGLFAGWHGEELYADSGHLFKVARLGGRERRERNEWP
jgi:hypothetical protein